MSELGFEPRILESSAVSFPAIVSRMRGAKRKHLTEGLSCSERGRKREREGRFSFSHPHSVSWRAQGKACHRAAGAGGLADLLLPPVLGWGAPSSGGKMRLSREPWPSAGRPSSQPTG